MTDRTVAFSPEALSQLVELQRYIVAEASPAIAARYTDALVSFCERLSLFPFRGRARNDIREGVRLTTFKSRTVVAYQVADDAVTVIGVFHGGQEYDGPSRRGG